MKTPLKYSIATTALAIAMFSLTCLSAHADESPYKVIKIAQIMGTGRTDYVYADSDNRRLYVPRGNSVLVFDLDTLAPLTPIPNLVNGHGVAVDPISGHGFCSSRPVIMWDARTLKTLKTINVAGGPDGILFEPYTKRIYVLSHIAPNITVLDGSDGSIVGTIDLGAAPEQPASDGAGHVYVDLEDKNSVAVVDAKSLKVTGTYSLEGNGTGPAGLGMDNKNKVLYAFCRQPAVAVILSATDGKILGTAPIGHGTDGGGFNQATGEAFASAGDGTVTLIKQNGPASFAVEQTVETIPRARTSTLDATTNHIIVITTDRPATAADAAAITGSAPAPSAAGASPGGGMPDWRRAWGKGPSLLHIVVIGR